MSVIKNKAEREEILRVLNERKRVAKAGIEHRQAELLAQVEAELAAEYSRNDEAWAEITAQAEEFVRAADTKIAARCKELGVRPEFRPGLVLSWYKRGANADKDRRAELRKVAQSRLEAEGRKAKLAIDTAALERREALVAGALDSAEAREFLASMPTVEQLMPVLTVAELEAGS